MQDKTAPLDTCNGCNARLMGVFQLMVKDYSLVIVCKNCLWVTRVVIEDGIVKKDLRD